MRYPNARISLAAVVALGCSGSSEPAAPPALEFLATELSIDALSAPRDGNGLVAGEEVRIGLHLRGGAPPYTGHVRAVRQGPPVAGARTPLDATFSPGPEAAQTPLMDVATKATLDARALSGVYQLELAVVDAAGHQATARSADFRLIGDDAPVLPETAAEGAFARVVDVAGRQRRSFVRGETVTVRVHMPGRDRAAVELRDPAEHVLARTRLPLDASGDVRFPIDVPRLAAAGAHQIIATAAQPDGAAPTPTNAQVKAEFAIDGPAWPAAGRLLVEALHIYGGKDQRAPRAGILRRGEDLILEARVAGGQHRVALRVQLSGAAGVAHESDLGQTEIARAEPTARAYASGTWRVPQTVRPGRYQLQVEVTEGDAVSLRTRDVLVL